MNKDGYKIMHVGEAIDSVYGEVFGVEANPVINDGFSLRHSVLIGQDTETFFFPKDTNLLNQVLMIARGGGLWYPNEDDFLWERRLIEDRETRFIYSHKSFFMMPYEGDLNSGLADLRTAELERDHLTQQGKLESLSEKCKEEKKMILTMKPFTFRSNSHQRYENNSPVRGLQNCSRTISVVENTNGCPGYKLEAGKGYIVKIFNDDQGKPNMSDKPMIVVGKTDSCVELRGFNIEAITPFGWQEVDYSDYGLKVWFVNGTISRCVLYMFDRNIRIEYYACEESISQNKQCVALQKLTETESLVREALDNYLIGNKGDETYHPLYKAWRSFQNDPSQLTQIKDYGRYGKGLMIFLFYKTVYDIDDKQQLASVAYLFLSKAIKTTSNNVNYIKDRLLLMVTNREAFEYTVSSVVNKDYHFLDACWSPFKARDAMFKMEFADLSSNKALLSIDMLASIYNDLRDKIASGFWGQNETEASVLSCGKNLHEQILVNLEEKVIENKDLDF